MMASPALFALSRVTYDVDPREVPSLRRRINRRGGRVAAVYVARDSHGEPTGDARVAVTF